MTEPTSVETEHSLGFLEYFTLLFCILAFGQPCSGTTASERHCVDSGACRYEASSGCTGVDINVAPNQPVVAPVKGGSK